MNNDAVEFLSGFLPNSGLTKEQEELYINIICNIKDVTNTENPLPDSKVRQLQVYDLRFKYEHSGVTRFSGFLVLEDPLINKDENRCITGTIEELDNGFYVSSEISRLMHPKGNPLSPAVYTTTDLFEGKDNRYHRTSSYNYINLTFKDEISIGELSNYVKINY